MAQRFVSFREQVLSEMQQGAAMRVPLLEQWQKLTGRYPLTYFANFEDPQALITDDDVDLIEDLLQGVKRPFKLDLIMESPGGYPLSAERLVNVCCKYSGDFRVVVPKRAKSAATMVAMGAGEILLGPVAELGPIDPQVTYRDRQGQLRQYSVYSMLKSIDEIMGNIQQAPQGARIEGLLAMLPPVDQAFVVEMRHAQKLAEELALQWCSKMPAHVGRDNNQIRKRIEVFLDPEATYAHGRPIDMKRAKRAGLPVVELRLNSPQWALLWEIYTRSSINVGRGGKAVETAAISFKTAPVSPSALHP